MENTIKEYSSVEKFIFNDEVQDLLSKINNNVMDFNILELTGMGTQEIKHSNMLSWILGDNEHGLEYTIFDKLFHKISDISDNQKLKHYLYLPTKNKALTIYREKDNIDLLIVDNANNVVVAIENKVYANERVDGEDGGQLNKYETIVKNNYQNFDQYFIYLTIDLEDASRKGWLNASYHMIVDSISEIMNSNIEINTKTKIILESYIDLLKRNGIVNDKDLEILCEKIWNNKEYANAMDILLEYRKTPISNIFDRLKEEYGFEGRSTDLYLTGIEKLYKKFDENWDQAEQIFEIQLNYFGGKNESIWLGYWYPDLEKQNEKELTTICETIIGKNIATKRYKQSAEILRINEDYIENKSTDIVVDEIINLISGINERIETILNKN